ncbi:EamA family transporter [Paracandidimonas soli]|uniref:Inner membrane transporter RhtA n=1 Tax=Paracandidimonas soli TaxID=1917182 RepID=A0A4R3VCI8_9BURK|nr:EamA family transporter [Paracandidimonas soli]TCV01851.1 inner membrane transporter RhtA [Paracandidimonas soli]
MNAASPASKSQPLIGALAVVSSLVSQNIGAAFAKTLFPLVGPAGMAFLRIGLAACLLVLIRRAWKATPRQDIYRSLLLYGTTLGVMNLVIYQAFARIPIGVAVAIEILGPLAVVLLGARKKRDFVWLATAVCGLVLLLPLTGGASALDPIGVACAIGAAVSWALYILSGKRLASEPGVDAVAWGMVVAAIVTLPFGVAGAGAMLLSPDILLIGLAVAALSSAIPYSLEMTALQRMAAPLFSIVVSTAPAIAAIAGFFILDERLTAIQWLAIVLIMSAAAGSTLGALGRTARDGK